jgi:hypothetical protein
MNSVPLDLTEKILHVRYIRRTKILEILLEKCSLKTQEGRVFLIGTWLRSDSTAWNAGLHVAIAWDCVTDYLIYDSLEEYRVRSKRYKDTHDDKGKRLPKR